ncbi:hypothetical protein, partial [Nonomuraea angiospora]|uniref:hypothetical protein n=1 Tax=Nonomuraea angiospora TaxID=46172 RepID=UPI0029A00A15
MDQTISLTGHFYGDIRPDQVIHRLTDDGWSTFDYGPFRVTVPAADLTRVRAARQLAQTIAAQAGFWDGDLAELEARLVRVEDTHTAEPPAPVQNPT